MLSIESTKKFCDIIDVFLFVEAILAIRCKLCGIKPFFKVDAGASCGRSATTRKNGFLFVKAFHCYQG
jgi:hypothetical protein